jgi:hypothetical protein
MQTTDQLIDEILLKSPYGAKSYADRLNRQRKQELDIQQLEDETIDHPEQTFINFEEDNNE